MRLISVTIRAFKNLRDVTVDFDEDSPYTVLVGENGAGKSNLIEAITTIFRDLDLDQESTISYQIEYICRGNHVRAAATRGERPDIQVREAGEDSFARIPRSRFMSEDETGSPRYRPAFVFGYYSGTGDRLAELYDKHRERFYAHIIKPRSKRDGDDANDPNSLRRLFYALTLHGQFALLAFFMAAADEEDEDLRFLRENLRIEELESVLFVFRQPPWKRKSDDDRFWGAEGEVRDFLERLYEAAWQPIRMQRRIKVDLKRDPEVEGLYLFLPGPEELRQVYNLYRDQYSFFTALESTHLSKVLGEVRARVRLAPEMGSDEVTYRDLSEGEQQLLLVLGLLKFTARDEALFLLDEPDTHLNPVWGTQYLAFLDRFIKARDGRERSCHIVMSSHDPLVFAGLTRDEVRILRRDRNGGVSIEVPETDPQGMGVAAILTSDLFRLQSTLDIQTQHQLDKERLLANREQTPEVSAELAKIREDLRGKGFSQTVRDPLYELFLKAWGEREEPAWRTEVRLTPEQRLAREQLAAEIADELAAEAEER